MTTDTAKWVERDFKQLHPTYHPKAHANPLVIERAFRDDEQLVDLERFLQVIERAETHRFDRALDRRVRRHHDDLRPLAGRGGQLAHEIQPGISAVRPRVPGCCVLAITCAACGRKNV